MTAIEPITDKASYQRAEDRVLHLIDNWSTKSEFEEAQALATEIEKYDLRRDQLRDVHSDAADRLEFLLDMENTTLEQLDSLLGGRDVLIDIMTRRRRLTESEVDRLAARLKVDWEELDREIRKPEGWQDIDIPEGPTDWRAEMIAHRDAKEGTNRDRQDRQVKDANASSYGAVSPGGQDDAATREPELVAT